MREQAKEDGWRKRWQAGELSARQCARELGIANHTFAVWASEQNLKYVNQRDVDLKEIAVRLGGDIDDEHWALVEEIFRSRRPGRTLYPPRQTLNGILWKYRTGQPWSALPAEYGKSAAVNAVLLRKGKSGELGQAIRILLDSLRR